MPIIIGLITLIAGAYFWANRARNAGAVAQDLAGMARDVVNAARAFGFRRRANIHPVEALEDGKVAIAGIAVAFLELGGLPNADEQDALIDSLQQNLAQGAQKAEEAAILGRWLVTECGDAARGFDRLARRLYKIDGSERFDPLMAILKDIAAHSRGGLSPKQADAIKGLAATFRIK